MAAATQAPKGTRLTIFEDLASIPLFNEDLDEATGGGGDAVARLRRAIRERDGRL